MKYTDVKGLTKVFPVSRTRIYELVEKREIPFYRFGKSDGSKIMFKVEEVERWMRGELKELEKVTTQSEKELLKKLR